MQNNWTEFHISLTLSSILGELVFRYVKDSRGDMSSLEYSLR